MSSSSRTTSKGGKGPKTDKTHKNEKSDSVGKGPNEKQQAGGGGDNSRSKSEDPTIREKVSKVMEFMNKTEEEVCLALHECDNDIESAMNMLLDSRWEIAVKKKKSKQPASSKTENVEIAGEDWNDQSHKDNEKPRNKSGGPPRLHGRHNDSRGWRGREKQENERNLEGGSRPDHRDRRGRPGGPTRGGPGRGRGGGRAGSRYPPRSNRNFNNRPIETWDNNPSTWDNNTTTNHTDNWDDGHIDEWSTEEYTGSLADTKVFTPSMQTDAPQESEINIARSPLPEERTQVPLQQGQMPTQSPVPLVGTLNAAQTQYLNQLTQQNSDLKTVHMQNPTYGSAAAQGPQQYNSSQYGSTHSNAYVSTYNAVSANYGNLPDTQPTQQPVRTKTQRARVPPPSKIPSSAVVMPGDLAVDKLDVQFGVMDLETMSFEGVTDPKFNSTPNSNLDATNTTSSSSLDLNSTNQASTMESYNSHQKSSAQSSISSALSQSLTNNENIPQTSEHLTAGYSSATRTSMTGNNMVNATPSTIELSKQPESHSYSQSSTYNSYQPKSSSYQTQNYNTPSYSTTQTTTAYGSSQPNNYASSNTGSSYNTPAGNTTYQNYSASSYQSNANVAGYPPSITQANSYPTSNQGYSQSASQSVYGANAGLNNSSNYGNTTSPQYNSYSSNANHKLVKDNTYDSSSTTVNSTATSTSVSTVTSALSLTQTTATGTKATTTSAKSTSGVVSNIPPGVAAPVMSTPYIMSQGISFYQPPPMYTYEDVQLLQQRIPHMTPPFYEMSYQTPTTLTAVRDQPLSTYAMSDARFTRGDNNASPVPSTLSQQTSTLTQGHQGGQPILAQTPQTYFFATPYSPMQSYQFGAVYGQIPAATNAHGSSNSTQYPKPSTYGSGYGSAYDALGQSQDYSKGGYVSNTQGQTKGTGASASSTGTTGNDLSAMYSKSHTAIGKVNSYDKQGFHSGTPPPFSGTMHGNQNAGLAPSGSGYGPQMYIPTMPPHQQHHSTQLMHQPLHQMDVRHQGRRMDSGNSSGQRSQASNQAKSGATKFQNPYWNQP